MIGMSPAMASRSRRGSCAKSSAHRVRAPRERRLALPEFTVEKKPLDGQSEVIEGLSYRFPRESKAHLEICARVERQLKEFLCCSLAQVFARRDRRPLCTGNSTLYPDFWVSTLAVSPARERRVAYPGLVIEVLSPAREKIDRGAKLRAYRRIETVREILFIDPIKRCSEHFVRIDEAAWKFADVPAGGSVFLESIGESILAA